MFALHPASAAARIIAIAVTVLFVSYWHELISPTAATLLCVLSRLLLRRTIMNGTGVLIASALRTLRASATETRRN